MLKSTGIFGKSTTVNRRIDADSVLSAMGIDRWVLRPTDWPCEQPAPATEPPPPQPDPVEASNPPPTVSTRPVQKSARPNSRLARLRLYHCIPSRPALLLCPERPGASDRLERSILRALVPGVERIRRIPLRQLSSDETGQSVADAIEGLMEERKSVLLAVLGTELRPLLENHLGKTVTALFAPDAKSLADDLDAKKQLWRQIAAARASAH